MDGFSQALLRHHQDRLDERGRDYLRRIRGAAVRMGQLIDDLLRLSRIARAKVAPQPVDLGALAAAILTNLARAEPDRVVEVAVERPLIAQADPALLEAALTNLLDNAWKYTSRHARARIEVGSRIEGVRRVYFVRDDGAGFDMRYADKLFGSFQRLHTDEEFPGTGIGLATVRRIIRRHGGEIWAEAAVEKGATFSFTLGEDHGADAYDPAGRG
jgi:light-regulated signal transduction histidine kinase (bacteriophytochrome)